MAIFRILLSSVATAVIGSVAAGFVTFCFVVLTKPDQAAAAVPRAVGVGMIAGAVGLIAGLVGSLLFPSWYLKGLGIAVLVLAVLLMLVWRVFSRLG